MFLYIDDRRARWLYYNKIEPYLLIFFKLYQKLALPYLPKDGIKEFRFAVFEL